MTKIVGPMGFSDQDPEGFMVEGFEETPTIACTYNLDSMNPLVIGEGYRKEVDYVVYRIPVPDEMPEEQLRVIDRIARRGNFRLVEFSKRSELKPLVRPVLGLMNECFKDIYGYAPLDETEMLALAKRYLHVLDPRFTKLVLDRDGVISGFIIGLPNFSEGIKRSKGRLFPLGLIWILRASKRTRQLDLVLGGVKEKYRGLRTGSHARPEDGRIRPEGRLSLHRHPSRARDQYQGPGGHGTLGRRRLQALPGLL